MLEQKARIFWLGSSGKDTTHKLAMNRFLKHYQERQSLEHAPKTRCPPKGVTIEMIDFIDREMENNSEITWQALSVHGKNSAGSRPVPSTAC